MCDLEERIANIEKNIEEINVKISQILETMNKDLTKDCKKMAEHIDFVENVYENVKHPLNYICSKVTPLISSKDRNNTMIEGGTNHRGMIDSELDYYENNDDFFHDSDIDD